MRVVSMVPSVTESLLHWGVVPVACTRFCEQPTLAHVGGTKDPDVAAILQRFPGAKITDVRIRAQETEDEAETVEAVAAAESAEGDILPGDDIEH